MEEKQWFEEWFDSPYYPLLYKKRNVDEARKFIQLLVKSLEIDEDSTALDLACGEGRHSLELNKQGLQVTGIDLSMRSIDIARKLEKKDLEFFIEDMRRFELNRKFDFIFNLFTSFGYFDSQKDNLLVLDQVYKHLNKKGILIIDFLNGQKVIDSLVPYEYKEIDGIQFEIKKEINESHVIKKIKINDGKKEFNYFEKVQLFSLENFEDMLSSKNFKVGQVYGDYELTDFNEMNSDRLIIFAQKMN